MSLFDFSETQSNVLTNFGFRIEHTDAGPVFMRDFDDGAYTAVWINELSESIVVEHVPLGFKPKTIGLPVNADAGQLVAACIDVLR